MTATGGFWEAAIVTATAGEGADRSLAAAVAAALGSDVRAMARVHGGDVAMAFRVDLDDGRTVFAKTHARPPAGFFTTEATGLRWLREPGVVGVPVSYEVDGTQFVAVQAGYGVDAERQNNGLQKMLAPRLDGQKVPTDGTVWVFALRDKVAITN